MDLADAPYYRDLFRFFAPQPDSSNLGLDPAPDPDHDSWATFSNTRTDQYNRRLRTPRKLKKQRPSGFLFSPSRDKSNITPRSPACPPPRHFDFDSVLTVQSNPYQNIITPTYPTRTRTPAQATPTYPTSTRTQTQIPTNKAHGSYSSSFYSQPSNYSNTHFDHRDLPSPLSPPPIIPRSGSGIAGVQYSLPPTPRSTLRVVDKETLNRLEGITEESRSGSGSGHEQGSRNGSGDLGDGLEDIPITPSPSLPPQGQQQLGDPSWRQRREEMAEWQPWPHGTEGQQQRWEPAHRWDRQQDQEQEPKQETKHVGTFSEPENRGERITRWPGVWGLRSSVRQALRREEEEEVDGQSITSSKKHRRGGGVGFRARSTKLFSTIGAWLNGIDDGHSFRSGRGSRRGRREDEGWDMV